MRTSAIVVIVSVAIALTGCATAPKDIVADSVSPSKFQTFDCDNLRKESDANLAKAGEVAERLGRFKPPKNADETYNYVAGWAFFWWMMPFVQLYINSKEQEYARMKGEYEALQQAADLKQCPVGTVTKPYWLQ
jgi:hypothetical protein